MAGAESHSSTSNLLSASHESHEHSSGSLAATLLSSNHYCIVTKTVVEGGTGTSGCLNLLIIVVTQADSSSRP